MSYYKDGYEIGKAAASWCIDGNTTDETKRRILKGIEDGDPEILDSFNLPNLSGKFADDPTPKTFAEDYEIENDDELDEAMQDWENGVYEGFWTELERLVRA